MIAIIDYDAGNIKSVEKALQKLGQDVVITREKEQSMVWWRLFIKWWKKGFPFWGFVLGCSFCLKKATSRKA